MSPLVLASQSQALPLLLLPFAMATGHAGVAAKRLHAPNTAVAPILYPLKASGCHMDDDSTRKSGDRYVFVIDARFGLSIGSNLSHRELRAAAM